MERLVQQQQVQVQQVHLANKELNYYGKAK
jgi:hypothetical protein